MTLTKFKYKIKVLCFLFFILIYTGAVFYAGKNSNKILSENPEASNQGQSLSLQSKIANPQGQENAIQSSQVLASYIKLCSNTVMGFELAYPKDWFTSYNDSKDQCLYFAPFSFVLPEISDQEITPISIKIIKADEWEDTVKLYENPNEFYNVITSNNLEINGRSVKQIKSSSTGSGNLGRGFIRTSYLIFESKTPMIISFNQLTEKDDNNLYEKILEDMVFSLKLF